METVDLSPDDATELTDLYSEYNWWADREETSVREALKHTPLGVGLRDDGELVAAARVITDFVYYAKVYDVLVAENRRGEGLGTILLEALVDQPKSLGLTHSRDVSSGTRRFLRVGRLRGVPRNSLPSGWS